MSRCGFEVRGGKVVTANVGRCPANVGRSPPATYGGNQRVATLGFLVTTTSATSSG